MCAVTAYNPFPSSPHVRNHLIFIYFHFQRKVFFIFEQCLSGRAYKSIVLLSRLKWARGMQEWARGMQEWARGMQEWARVQGKQEWAWVQGKQVLDNRMPK